MGLMGPDYDPREDEILLMNSKYLDLSHGEAQNAILQLLKIQRNRPRSIVAEVKIYRKYVPKLLEAYWGQCEAAKMAVQGNKRFMTDCADKKNRRWTPQEDNLLIDLVCSEGKSIMEIAVEMGRSVSAIKTRVSTLVGRKRITQKIAGRFLGEIDGEQYNAIIDGVLYKEE